MTESGFPKDPQILLALEPEEVAKYLLRSLASGSERRNILNLSDSLILRYDADVRTEVLQVLSEGWAWLESQGLLVRDLNIKSSNSKILSRRARKLNTDIDFDAYLKASLLPRAVLTQTIVEKVLPTFLRGEYDTSVFQAFKEVEVAVRNAGGFQPTDIGVDLMRKAFNASGGPLIDTSAPKAEREALSNLFAGAIGSYKNPSSHRHVPITVGEAVEMIMLASHLLKIVESRVGTATP